MTLSRLREMIVKPKPTPYPIGTVVEVKAAPMVVVKTQTGLVECSSAISLVVGDRVRLQDRVVIGKPMTLESVIPAYKV